MNFERGDVLSSSDRDTLDALRQAGSNLSRSHPIRHYLYFPQREAALAAQRTLAGEGYRVEVRRAAKGPDWLALASHTLVPTDHNVAATTARMEQLASSLHGEYDGWEAQVMP